VYVGVAWGVAGVLVGAGSLALQGALAFLSGPRGLPGPALAPAAQPELAQLLREVAERVEHRAPFAVALIPVPDAFLARTRLDGARVDCLALGLPLLQHLTQAELAAVVAHELGHRAHLDDRRASAVLRARGALADAVAAGAVLPRLIGTRLLRRTQGLSFSFEAACDEQAVAACGTTAVAGALRAVDLQADCFGLALGWCEHLEEQGAYPADLYPAYRVVLADPVVRERARRRYERAAGPDPADSHPPTPERLRVLPDGEAGPWSAEPVPLRDGSDLERLALRELLGEPEGEPVRVLDDPGRVSVTPEDELRRVLRATTGASDLDDLATRLADRGLQEALRADDERRDAVAQSAGRLLARQLQAAGWQRVSPWVAGVVVGPAGTRRDLADELEDALTADDPAAALRAVVAR